MNQPDLASLQAWMQQRITAGNWAFADDAEIRAAIVGSANLHAEQRMGIYATSYVMRLAECMRAEFPILRALIGDQVFNLFVGSYLSAVPPASYSLYHLGAGFADYLEATRPKPHSGPGTAEALPANLARLERAMAEADRAEGVEARPDRHLDLLALLQGRGMCCRVPPATRLLRLDFDFSEVLADMRADRQPRMPAAQTSCVAVARNDYRVRVHPLEPWAFTWLAALAANGGDIWAAARTAAERTGRDLDAITTDLLPWLPWAGESGCIVMQPTDGTR